MQVGLLTARFKDKPLAEIIEWAAGAGFQALEVASDHLGLDASKGVSFSSIAHYDGGCLKSPVRASRGLAKSISRAAEFGTDVVCALAGVPLDGTSKEESLDERFKAVFGPAVEAAEKHGIKIAIENWFATCFQHFDLWDRAFDLVPSSALGLNYDPSHLHWQGIDYVGGVERYAKKIFHVHAKDVTIDRARLESVGCLEKGWWRYSIPGQGEIEWGRFIGALRSAGYDGVLSIEHEDRAVGTEEGFELGLRYLRKFV